MSERISFGEINRLAIPAVLAGIMEPVIALSDLAIIGRVPFDRTEALAAIGVASSFIASLTWIFTQTRTAISSIVAQHYGARTLDSIRPFVGQAMWINILTTLIVVLITRYCSGYIFTMYNAKDGVLDYALEYFNIRIYGFAFSLMASSFFGVFRGLQNTRWIMYISISCGLIHILLDIVLVYGIKGIIPAMHVKGAAYAGLITQVLMCVWALYYYLKHTGFNLSFKLPWHPEVKRLSSLSKNLIIRTVALNTAIYFGNFFANRYGDHVMAAQAILMNIWLFSSFFIDGYANAALALGGRLLGAKDYRGLWLLSLDLKKVTMTVTVGLSVVYIAGYYFIGPLFSNDKAVLQSFNSVFWMVILMGPLGAIAFTYDGLMKGTGEAIYLRNNLLIATFVFFIPLIYLFDGLQWSIYGIWWSFFVWMCIRAFGLMYLFKKKYYHSEQVA